MEDLTRENVLTIVRLEQAEQNNRSTSHKLAAKVANFCGSTPFLWMHIIWFASWISYNCLSAHPFDSFPFSFLGLLVTLETIFLSCFILITQKNETRLSERRNHLNLQINLLAEQENTMMLQLLQQIAEKVGAPHHIDPTLEVLKQATEPEKLIEQIESIKDEIAQEEVIKKESDASPS